MTSSHQAARDEETRPDAQCPINGAPQVETDGGPQTAELIQDHAQHLLSEIPEDLGIIAARLTNFVNGHESHGLPAEEWINTGHQQVLKAISTQADALARDARIVLLQIVAAHH